MISLEVLSYGESIVRILPYKIYYRHNCMLDIFARFCSWWLRKLLFFLDQWNGTESTETWDSSWQWPNSAGKRHNYLLLSCLPVHKFCIQMCSKPILLLQQPFCNYAQVWPLFQPCSVRPIAVNILFLSCSTNFFFSFKFLIIRNNTEIMNIWKSYIPHFHLDHNAPHLFRQILHSHCFQFFLGITVIPREDNGYKNFWRVNKVHYGLCENSELVTAVWRTKWKKIVLITFIYTAQIQLYSFQMRLVVVIGARLVGELNPWSLSNWCSTLPIRE